MPVQSRMPVPAAAEQAVAELAARAASLDAASGGNLLECFASVPDPRDARGIRHSLASVLALPAAAVQFLPGQDRPRATHHGHAT